MRPRLLLPLCALLLAPAAAAQPSAAAVLDGALAAYEAMMADVHDYTLTQEVMGGEMTMYFERREGGGPFDYATFLITPTGLQEIGEESEASMPLQNPALFARMKERAHLVGTHPVGGRAAHAVVVEDFGALAKEFNATPDVGDGELDVETATFYFDADDALVRQISMAGTMTQEGRTAPFEMDIVYDDYRAVSGMHYPFQATMKMRGMDAGMDPGEREEARKQLEEARRQMEQMPPEQRQMMERMMGGQLQQLERMLEGEAMEMQVVVKRLEVNAGRPE